MAPDLRLRLLLRGSTALLFEDEAKELHKVDLHVGIEANGGEHVLQKHVLCAIAALLCLLLYL